MSSLEPNSELQIILNKYLPKQNIEYCITGWIRMDYKDPKKAARFYIPSALCQLMVSWHDIYSFFDAFQMLKSALLRLNMDNNDDGILYDIVTLLEYITNAPINVQRDSIDILYKSIGMHHILAHYICYYYYLCINIKQPKR